MYAAGANVSYVALMKRELGLHTRLINSVLEPSTVLSKEDNSLRYSIQQPCCLVAKKIQPCRTEEALKKRDELHTLQKGPIRITFAELSKFLGSQELQKCYKKVMKYYGVGPFTRKQIIVGIEMRAQELFHNDPEYVQKTSENLEKILRCHFEEQTRKLYFSILLSEQQI